MTSRAIAIAERLARQFIPDLADRPLYFVGPRDGSMVTRAMMTGDGCYFPHLDLALRPQLEAEGRWRGEGVAVVVDATLPAGCDEFSAERAIVALAVHETLHWVTRPEPDTPEPNAADHYQRFVDSHAPTFAAYADRGPTEVPGALWAHGDAFIRAACHVWYRSTHLPHGYFLRPEHIGFGSAYPGLEMLSEPGQYSKTLLAEVQEHRHRPLRTILAADPPREFTDLWNRDLARVFDSAIAARAQAA